MNAKSKEIILKTSHPNNSFLLVVLFYYRPKIPYLAGNSSHERCSAVIGHKETLIEERLDTNEIATDVSNDANLMSLSVSPFLRLTVSSVEINSIRKLFQRDFIVYLINIA